MKRLQKETLFTLRDTNETGVSPSSSSSPQGYRRQREGTLLPPITVSEQTDTCFAQAGHDSWLHGCPHVPLAQAGLPALWHQGAAAWGTPAPPSPHFHQLLKVQQQLFLVRARQAAFLCPESLDSSTLEQQLESPSQETELAALLSARSSEPSGARNPGGMSTRSCSHHRHRASAQEQLSEDYIEVKNTRNNGQRHKMGEATAEAKIQSTHYIYKLFQRDRTEHEVKTQGKHIHCSSEILSSIPPRLQLQELLLQVLEILPQARGLAPRLLQLRLGLRQLLSARLQLLLCSAQRLFLFQKLSITRLSLALQMTSQSHSFSHLGSTGLMSFILLLKLPHGGYQQRTTSYIKTSSFKIASHFSISDLISIILCEEGEEQTRNGQTLGKDIFRRYTYKGTTAPIEITH
ncbi:hypothetical protein IHE44_0007299 [Lamprotornis superbus]|uniref:Uncharacterized protein n=1 Tax=Lamprotornis superbus TaxID=245042 RepID=A0A835TX02_9PASS|nr:hypothetical protein IHE44_0007299 [Lamprotornis superbus]